MTHEAIVHGPLLTLRGPGWEQTLSQGQCAAVVCMAEMHNAQPAQPSGDDAADSCAPLPVLHVNGTWTIAGKPATAEEVSAGFWKIICGMNAELRGLRASLAEAQADATHCALHHEAAETDKCHYRTDRDRLAAQVETLTKERDEAQGLIHYAETAQGEATAERDKALAALAAANERAEKAERYAEVLRVNLPKRFQNIPHLNMRCAMLDEESALEQRDAAKAEVAALRADLDGFHNLSAMRQCMIDVADDNKALKAEVAARNAAFARWKEETQKDVARIAELNAEVTALKERAVTIPLFVGGVGGHADGCDDMRRAAIKAIRAAGVKVVES